MTKETILSNPNILIGQTLSSASAYVVANDLEFRVVRDDEPLPAILIENLVNLQIEDNRVMKAWIG